MNENENENENNWPRAIQVIFQDLLVIGFLTFCVYTCAGGFDK